MAEMVSELVESVEESQNKQVPKDFHPRTEHGNNVNSPKQNRSRRPNTNFDIKNRSRDNNWPRNWSRSGPNNHNFAMQPARRKFNGRLIRGAEVSR